MVLITPRNPRRASSSPAIHSKSKPVRSFTDLIKVSPFLAKRTAAVATALIVFASIASAMCTKPFRARKERSIASLVSS